MNEKRKNGEQFAKWITLTLTIHTHAGFEYGLLMYVFFHFAVSLPNRNETNESCSRNKTLFRNLRLKIEFEVLWLFYLLPFLSHFSLSLIRFSFARHWLCVRFSFLNFFVINGLVFARANKHTHTIQHQQRQKFRTAIGLEQLMLMLGVHIHTTACKFYSVRTSNKLKCSTQLKKSESFDTWRQSRCWCWWRWRTRHFQLCVLTAYCCSFFSGWWCSFSLSFFSSEVCWGTHKWVT